MYQLNQIPSEAQIRKYLRRIVYGKNIYCPECLSRSVVRYETRYRRKRCRLKFSLLSKTWLSNLKLPLELFWLLLWCWTTQIPIKQTVALTNLSEVTVRHWFDVFRKHLPKNQEVLEKLIQMDEAHFGGKRGRTLFMAKEEGTRKLAFEILPHTNPVREEAWVFIQRHIMPESTLNTDGAGIYSGIDQWWPLTHQRA